MLAHLLVHKLHSLRLQPLFTACTKGQYLYPHPPLSPPPPPKGAPPTTADGIHATGHQRYLKASAPPSSDIPRLGAQSLASAQRPHTFSLRSSARSARLGSSLRTAWAFR